MTNSIDLITYAGEVSNEGYESLCRELLAKKSETAVLVLATPGGDPNAGFRIARALQHAYIHFDALVPRTCKSAGTLIVIGASTLYLDDMSELGPLDVQVKKGDELFARGSGLDIFQAVNYLQNQAMITFQGYLVTLTRTGLSTKTASDIASKLTTGLLEPISAQIDPMKLAEMERATNIAFEYGLRLNEKSKNLTQDGLALLVNGYPSHGFVIDRKESRRVFQRVERPEGWLRAVSERLHQQLNPGTFLRNPEVRLTTLAVESAATATEGENQHVPDPEGSSEGANGGIRAQPGEG